MEDGRAGGRPRVRLRPPWDGGLDIERFTLLPHGGAQLSGGSRLRRLYGPAAQWREALGQLRVAGHVELTDALRSGLISKDQADELLG